MLTELRRLTTKFIDIYRQNGISYALFRSYRYLVLLTLLKQKGGERALTVHPPAPVELIAGLRENHPNALKRARQLMGDVLNHTVSIENNYVCMYGKQANFAHSTAVVLAHWDPQNMVDPYVINMCRHFKSLGWMVILASANQIQGVEEHPDWIDAIVYRICAGYDFTSWKAALVCFPSLWKCEELILCNDSVFAPIGSYTRMHTQMAVISCDFWGITESSDLRPHLQSFHLVFRRKALEHQALKQFFNAVQMSNDRLLAIDYETILSIWLTSQGLQAGAFAPLIQYAPIGFNPATDQWQQLIESGAPVFKRELLLINKQLTDTDNWKELISSKQYNIKIIENYLLRTKKYFIHKK